MRPETPEPRRPLRYGFTTGACATAASLAAARLLLTGVAAEQIAIRLPRGRTALFQLEYCRRREQDAEAATRKDAGDDPDVTHGALIIARVRLQTEPGARFRAGPGVGVITRPGLPLPPGEPAINPTPRRMMTEHVNQLAAEQGYSGGFQITVGVERGAELAQRTLNPRLGIVGGVSILGVTGIVRPFSCSAYIASIQQAIDVARANGLRHIAACTGATSEQRMRRHYALPAMALIEMGDFVGAVLKHLRQAPVEKLSLAGGFGKFSKLAAGHLDLHSRTCSVDFGLLAEQAGLLGAGTELQAAIRAVNTSQQALELATRAGLPLADRICRLACDRAQAVVGKAAAVEIWALDRQGKPVGFAGPA